VSFPANPAASPRTRCQVFLQIAPPKPVDRALESSQHAVLNAISLSGMTRAFQDGEGGALPAASQPLMSWSSKLSKEINNVRY
jgi:hypothetical protein